MVTPPSVMNVTGSIEYLKPPWLGPMLDFARTMTEAFGASDSSLPLIGDVIMTSLATAPYARLPLTRSSGSLPLDDLLMCVIPNTAQP